MTVNTGGLEQKTIEDMQERIDELEAQVKELESYTKHLETEWVLTDDLDEARASWAALQENTE